MLRPQVRTHASHTGNARSPLIRPTDDDHPLLPEHSTLQAEHQQQQPPSLLSAASQLDFLGSRHPSVSSSPRTSRDEGRKREATVASARGPCDTEVYVHEVTKTDTLPRIILQYKIPVQVLRRANKLWANDSIQYKNTLFLPVDACGIQPNLIEDLPSSLVPASFNTTSTSISVTPKHAAAAAAAAPGTQEAPRNEVQRSTSPLLRMKKEKPKVVSDKLWTTRQVYVDGVGLVDVARVPSASLSYFPPSKNPAPLQSPILSVSLRYRDCVDDDAAAATAAGSATTTVRSSNDKRGSSFEILRAGAGQFAADAYNGTQGLIRRLKDKKNVNEIDLIEL